MSGNFAIKGGGVGPLMANAILNFHFDYVTPSLILNVGSQLENSSVRFLCPGFDLGTVRPHDTSFRKAISS